MHYLRVGERLCSFGVNWQWWSLRRRLLLPAPLTFLRRPTPRLPLLCLPRCGGSLERVGVAFSTAPPRPLLQSRCFASSPNFTYTYAPAPAMQSVRISSTGDVAVRATRPPSLSLSRITSSSLLEWFSAQFDRRMRWWKLFFALVRHLVVLKILIWVHLKNKRSFTSFLRVDFICFLAITWILFLRCMWTPWKSSTLL